MLTLLLLHLLFDLTKILSIPDINVNKRDFLVLFFFLFFFVMFRLDRKMNVKLFHTKYRKNNLTTFFLYFFLLILSSCWLSLVRQFSIFHFVFVPLNAPKLKFIRKNVCSFSPILLILS